MKRILVSGALANKPGNGGEAWVRLSWIRGLKRLGHEVHFIEQLSPENTSGAGGGRTTFEESVNLAYFRTVTEVFGLVGSASLVWNGGEKTFGLPFEELVALAGKADLLINVSGHLTLKALKNRVACRAYIDIDPGFTQFWQESGNDGAHLEGHDFYFTIGENIGMPECPIPTNGLRWRPVRQPVVLDDWPVSRTARLERFTTVASWRGSYGPVEFAGKAFGLKVHEFRKFLALPQLAPAIYEIALDIHPGDGKDATALSRHGWHLSDPRRLGLPHEFRRFVQGSSAEFSVAQGIYVETNSGWFSDRTIRYLASGKPVLVQDTGFSRNLPCRRGLIAFRTMDEAAAGVRQILNDYDSHCVAARSLAESHFNSDLILPQLLTEISHA